MSNRIIEAVLRLSTKLGSMAAFGQVAGKLDQVERKAKAFNRSQGMIATGANAMGRAIVTGLAGYATIRAVSDLVTEFADAERKLTRIAVNADVGKERLAGMFNAVNDVAFKYAMTQDQVVAGLESMVASGRSLDEAMSFLPAVTATAQAAGAEITDIATTADAIANSFHFAGNNMQRAFDILVTSGKQGKFELKDMAQYVPSLAPAMAALGYEGEKGLGKLASMLQTIRMQTGDASSAATNLQNVLQKMESNETARSFKKFGVDLRSEMAKARKEGRDLVDVFIELTNKATKGNLDKIPQLFTDLQFQQGMRALIMGKDAMIGFQKALANVDGATLHDLGVVLDGTQAKVDRMALSWTRFKQSLGGSIAPVVTPVMDQVSKQVAFDDALDAGYAKLGLSGWARWRDQLLSDQKRLHEVAGLGGFETPETRSRDAHRQYGEARRAGMHRENMTFGAGVDANGVPIPVVLNGPTKPLGPVRTSRVDGGYSPDHLPAKAAAVDEPSLMDQAVTAAARASAAELTNAGKEAGNEFTRMLAGMGKQFGSDAAAAFNANIKLPAVQGPAASLPKANVDSGKSTAGRVMGPR